MDDMARIGTRGRVSNRVYLRGMPGPFASAFGRCIGRRQCAHGPRPDPFADRIDGPMRLRGGGDRVCGDTRVCRALWQRDWIVAVDGSLPGDPIGAARGTGSAAARVACDP